MDFVTIHQLSREFDLPARVVRYRLLSFLQAGKFHEGEDFRREDYKDDRHFVWKVNPLSFMRVSGLKPKTLPVDPITTVNDPLPTVNQVDNDTKAVVNESKNPVNNPPESHTPVDNETLVDEFRKDLEREMIDFLKDQIAVKDRQLSEQAHQSKEINELNVKLMGATLQQSQKIEELLRLVGDQGSANADTGGGVNEKQSTVHNSVNNPSPTVNQVDNSEGTPVHEPSNEHQKAA